MKVLHLGSMKQGHELVQTLETPPEQPRAADRQVFVFRRSRPERNGNTPEAQTGRTRSEFALGRNLKPKGGVMYNRGPPAGTALGSVRKR